MFVFFMLWIFFFTWNSSDTFYILKLKKVGLCTKSPENTKMSWKIFIYSMYCKFCINCVFTIHQIDHYDKLCIKYVYYIFTIHPFFYKNSCAFISSIYDIYIIIFSFPSTISCNISFFKSKCKVVFFCFPFQDL